MVTPPAPGWAGPQAPPRPAALSAPPPASPGGTLPRLACVSSVHTPVALHLLCKASCPTPGFS